ncbi:F-actin-monooxygenase MICAL2-like isoform X1 [Coregonus clupeaformis]|uniref:F-actin-monooxygenase MICAL2-like isoform X1 n=1 Tax=Coregonus clupeaformis TaxID=59861 RepID=UPI001E1C3D90|nr:F-actin-monooxygenase MICAL2-like isoform X1 [Coregonus clupeaformis]
MGETEEEKDQAGKLFENFIQASTCKGTLQSFNILCRLLDLDPQDHETFYSSLKTRLTSWRAKALWTKLDKRTCHKEYKKGQACVGTKCLIIGGGPCGLRTAIELALLGSKVVVIEKRDTFSRNNVLHLWPYTIHDLKGLGAKKFYGKFCAGAIDHISIRQLQLMLLKIALLVAVEFHVNVEFVKLLEPPENQENDGPGWRAEIRPADHPVANIDFDVVVGADGRRNTLEGFKRKEFRGKLAIAITANFVNRNTTAEAKVEEISGVAFIFNQKFFLDLKEETGIDLENIVYYKDNTHYFVMTAKKQSLLDKGVIIHDYIDTEMLLSSENVNQEALLCYAREAADFGTNYQLPTLDFAINACGQPDVAMFDFTSMYASENAALVRERFGHQLLVALVGDSLLEPFWPMGTGCARGFLAAFDSAWMVKRWAEGRTPLEVLAERESLYRILPQTTTENIAKNFEQYTIDPGTRYPNLISTCVRQNQVRHLYINGELPVKSCSLERNATIRRPVNLARRESEIRPGRLLTWCQKQTEGYRNVSVTDLTTSWQSGLALCALIHRFRSHLIEFDALNEEDSANNLQLAFDLAEREFGIRPFTTGEEMAAGQEPDKTRMVTYLSKFYELFRGTPLPVSDSRGADENSEDYPSKAVRSMNKVLNLVPRKRVPKDEKKLEDTDPTYKRRRKVCSYLEEATNVSSRSASCVGEGREVKENKVRSMATQLLSKFEESTPSFTLRRQSQCDWGSGRAPRPRSMDMTETPRFTNLRQQTPPNPPPKTQFQSATCTKYVAECTARPPPQPPPKPKLSPQLQAQLQSQHQPQPQFQLQPKLQPPPSPNHTLRKVRQADQTRAQPQMQPQQPESTHYPGYSPSCHSAVLAMSRMLQRLQEVEEKITQKKAQTQNAREFHNKSIKEKAVHLRALFSGDVTSTSQPESDEQAIPPESGPILPNPSPELTSLYLYPEISLSTFSRLHPYSSSSSCLLQHQSGSAGQTIPSPHILPAPSPKISSSLLCPEITLSTFSPPHTCSPSSSSSSSCVLQHQSGSAEQTIPSLPILPAPTPKVTSLICPEITLSTFSAPQTFSSSSSILLQHKTSQSGGLDMQLCKKEMQREPLNESHVCHSSGSTHVSQQQHTAILQPKPEPVFNNVKQRTVGKVSLAIAARAVKLVTLNETDHRPKASTPCSPPASPPLSPGSLRREFPGSGDKCHSCQKRVYVVERISAEGLYFHRECFRCDTCGSALRQGGHAFDSEQGKLYCKLHFTQRKNGMNHRRTFNSHLGQNGAGVQEGSGTPNGDTTDDLQSQSPGTFSSRLRKSLSWPLSVTRAVCDSPRRLSRWVHGTAQAMGLHLRANVQDYAFLYELLSLGVPLLFILQEVLLQMYSETGPVSQSIQPLLLWLEEHLGHRLM